MRDVDDEIRRSLERLTGPAGEARGTDALWGDLVARRRKHRARNGVLAAVPVLLVAVLAAGVLSGNGSDGSRSDVATGGDVAPPDGAGPTVTVSANEMPSVEASTSPLSPSEGGWLRHTVTLRNTGTETVHLIVPRLGEMLGDDEVAVATGGCTFAGVPAVPCVTDTVSSVILEPGGTHEYAVDLWRDLPGMNPVTDATYVWDLRVQSDDRRANSASVARGSLTLTYDNLAAAAPDDVCVQGDDSRASARCGGVYGPVMFAPERNGEMEQALLTGQVLHDGDCLYLLQSDAGQYPAGLPIVWPYGTLWEDDPEGVRLADGTFVPAGAEIAAAGGMHDIDRLAELGHADSVAGRARQCAGDDVQAVAYVQGEVEVTGARGDISVPTYELDLPGTELVEDNPRTAGNTDVVLWSDGSGAFVSLTVRRGEPGAWDTPGAGATVPDETFPPDKGDAWLSEPQDPRTATMWWVRPSGDLWLLNGYWYGDSVPASAEAALRDWALGIVHDPTASPPYGAESPELALTAYEAAGDRPSRSRVWEHEGEEIVLLVTGGEPAAGPSNLLARGAPAVTSVPGLGEVWNVGTTYGWAVDGQDAWATLSLPDTLAGRSDSVLAAFRLSDE